MLSIGLGKLIIILVAVVLALVIGYVLGYNWRKKTAEGAIGSAEREAENIKLEAKKAAEAQE